MMPPPDQRLRVFGTRARDLAEDAVVLAGANPLFAPQLLAAAAWAAGTALLCVALAAASAPVDPQPK